MAIRSGAVVAIIVALPAIALLVLRLMGGSDGALIENRPGSWQARGVVVDVLDERRSGLRSGDLILAIDGRSVDAWAEDAFHPGTWLERAERSDRLIYSVERDGLPLEAFVTLGTFPFLSLLREIWGIAISVLGLLIVGTFVYWRRPRDPASTPLLLLGVGAASSTVGWTGQQVIDLVHGLEFWASVMTMRGANVMWTSALLHFALVFPAPRPWLNRRPRFIPMIYIAPLMIEVSWIALTRSPSASTLDWIGRWDRSSQVWGAGVFVAALAALIIGFRSAKDPQSRGQVRLVVYALGLAVFLAAIVWQLPLVAQGDAPLGWNLIAIIGLLVPMSIAVAILRYRLFDIDVLIDRTLLWGILTAFVVISYAGSVYLMGMVVDSRRSPIPSLVAAGLVAVLFQPARARAQAVVDRIVYGDRKDPYAVVTQLARRLETALTPDAVLPALTETVAQALKLPYVTISVGADQPATMRATFGLPLAETVSFPLTFQSSRIGELSVSLRSPGEAFTENDLRLVEDLARQIGIVGHMLQLTIDLQRSRQEIINAREEERRRLRRDLHDGIGPSLAGIMLKLDAARNILSNDQHDVDAMLLDVKRQTQQAVLDIRRVVYDLRPPALDELGLVAALREFAASMRGRGLSVSIEAEDRLPVLPAATEVAAFRIAQEALTNVVRHAGASECVIRIAVGAALVIEVVDDGAGIPAGLRPGVGLTAMRERASELGGSLAIDSSEAAGTRLVATLPLGTQAGP
jgi:two-component system, NarL family, sensor kinase